MTVDNMARVTQRYSGEGRPSLAKPKVAFYWCASCGGCEEAVVDLAEVVLTVVEAVDIAFWPVALDFKISDVEALADGELAASFINGAVRTSEQQEVVELLRRKSGAVVAFGACAWLGGIPGLANLYSKESILEWVYSQSPSVQNGDGTRPQEQIDAPEGRMTLPHFDETVRTLDQVIDVDYYLPGCPPPGSLIAAAVMALVEGKLPAKGTVLAPDVALCAECPRAETKPENPKVKGYKRPHEMLARPRAVPARPGLGLPRAGDAIRLRRGVHPREYALHGLYGTHQQGGGLRREGPVGHRVAP